MKVVITGGAGFIGSNLCRELLDTPVIDEVRVIDDFSTGYRDNLEGLDVRLFEASILEPEALDTAVNGADSIVHLAALGSVPRSIADPLRSHEVNATGTLRVLDAARRLGGQHVVMSSSSSVYGANPRLPKDETMLCQPMSPYAVSKLAAEQYANAFAKVYDLPVLPFRFFNVYGPRQRAGHAYAAVIPTFIDAALRGDPLPINGDGSTSRDFTYVGTVTGLLKRAILSRTVGGPTNLAFGSRTTLLDLVNLIEEQMGHPVARVHRDPRPGDVKHSQANNEVLRSLFPGVEAMPLEVGLARTVAWMRDGLDRAPSGY